MGYKQSEADHSLFVKSSPPSITVLLIYVDDVVLAGNNMGEISAAKRFLDSQFRVKDLGALRFFLGFEVARSKSGPILNQRKYTLELLEGYLKILNQSLVNLLLSL